MTKVKHQDYILEAIDQLRRRKARPDLSRICGYLFRRYSISCKDTSIALEKLVDAEIVIKVDYKGCASYRNAAKWSMLSYHKSKQEHDFVTTLVCRTVAELILVEPKYLDDGVPYEILGKHVARKDKRFTKPYFNYVLEHELENGALVKLNNGNYFVGDINAPNRQERSVSPETIGAIHSSGSTEFAGMSKSMPSSPVNMSPSSDVKSMFDAPSSPGFSSSSALKSIPPKPRGRKKKKANNTNLSNALTPELNDDYDYDDSVSVNASLPDDEVFEPLTPPKTSMDKQSEPAAKVYESVTKGKHKTDRKLGQIDLFDSKGSSNFKETGNSKANLNSQETVSTKNNKRIDCVDLSLNGRRKRSKKIVFDPSDNNLPKAKRRNKGQNKVSPPGSKNSSPQKQVRKNSCDSLERPKKMELNHTSSIFQPICGICDSSEKRIKGVLDSFIACTDCITKVHLKCFEGTKVAGSTLKVDVNNWQCANCKMCSVCEDSAEMDKLIICHACDEAFHAVCHAAISNTKTKILKDSDQWFCSNCSQTFRPVLEPEDVKIKLEPVKYLVPKQEPLSNSHSSLSCSRGETDSESVDQKESVNFESFFNDPFEGHPVDESVPDASKWSSEDVYKYFTKYFQPSIAEIFKKQDIDGLSLLLLKRCDILSDFDLKLGPALKVYGHVKRLQIRRTAPQLLWL